MRAEAKYLPDVLFGKARGSLLALFYGHPDESFYYRQIARRLAPLSVGTLQRELETLSGLGLINRSATGNQVFYSANRNHPVFTELRGLIAKTIGSYEVLRSALSKIADRVTIAFVYGSMARQEEKAESDIDLMVIGDAPLEDVLEVVGDAETTLGRAVNPTVYSVSEFKSKRANDNHFVESVLRGAKVFLIGDEHELEKMGGVRLDQSRADQSRRSQRSPHNR